MKSCLVNLCIFLFLTVEGTRGSELTINVRKNASVTLVCSTSEDLKKCICPSYPQNCPRCTDAEKVAIPFENNGAERYFVLSGLENGNSGLYVCSGKYDRRITRRYRLNVFEDHQDPTVVIGTVGQTVVMSCGAELDIMAASGKHWCRLSSENVCQPDTVMGPESKTRGEFKILDSNGSFSLEKSQLTHNDTGSYRFTQITNQTKVCVVELQVKDELSFLHIVPVRVEPFQIACQYSQDLQEFSKSCLCDGAECDDTVRSVDDRFQSALVVTVDHVACSKITSFQCVAKTSSSPVKSNVYQKPSYRNPVVEEYPSSYRNSKKVQVKLYNQLNLVCFKPERYEYDRHGRWGSNDYYVQTRWCRVTRGLCETVKENIMDTRTSVILQICVTPNDDGTTYRCTRWNTDVEIDVIEPPPPAPPRPRPVPPVVPTVPGGPQNHLGVIIVVTLVVLLIMLLSVTVIRYQGKKLRERLFARRTPLAAVDVHANSYANSVANYYSHRREVPPPDEQGEGDDKDTSSSLDDEFEELPVRPKTSSSAPPEETEYVRVKPRGAAWPRNVNALLRDSEQFGHGGSGLGRKGQVGYTSETNTDNVVKNQCEDAAQRNSGCSNDEDDDDVTYTHVTIKPKHRLK